MHVAFEEILISTEYDYRLLSDCKRFVSHLISTSSTPQLAMNARACEIYFCWLAGID